MKGRLVKLEDRGFIAAPNSHLKAKYFFKNFEIKLVASASKFRPKTDKAIGVQAMYKHTVVHKEPAKYHQF